MGAVQFLYDALLRSRLSSKIGVMNGVAVRNRKLLDRTDENWAHKSGMVEQIDAVVQPGDRVVEVGSGFGVLTVRAARATTRSGQVHGYEAAADRISQGRETLRLNDVDGFASVDHAIVGAPGDVFGDPGGAEQIGISELPSFDVLVADCDGGERAVLESLTEETAPRGAVIESHGMHGSSTKWVRGRIEELGLRVDSAVPASSTTPAGEDNQAVRAEQPRANSKRGESGRL